MKGSLSKTELAGILLLAFLIVAITGSSIVFRNCAGENREDGETMIMEASDASKAFDDDSDDSDGESRRKGSKKKSGRKGSSKKSSGRAGSSKSARENAVVERPDPFADTIPLDWVDDFQAP